MGFFYSLMEIAGPLFFGLIFAICYIPLAVITSGCSAVRQKNTVTKNPNKYYQSFPDTDRLNKLMETEKIFRDEEISLRKLVAFLDR